ASTKTEVKVPTVATLPKSEETFEDWKVGESVILKNVLFEQSKYVLLTGSYEELDKLVNTLKKHPKLQIEVAGHTDNAGDPRLNQALSENRAQVIASYLVRHGIEESRITSKGHGSMRPIANNSTEEERAKNRRVEFMVK
ncbi:MAG: OmpA family protein, partial [Bacteroidota bacterium]